MPDDRLFIYLSAREDNRKWVLRANQLPTYFALQVVRYDENFNKLEVLVTRYINEDDTLTALIPLIPLFYEDDKMIGIRPHQLLFEIKCMQEPALDRITDLLETLNYTVTLDDYSSEFVDQSVQFFSPSGSLSFGNLTEGASLVKHVSLNSSEFNRLLSIREKNSNYRLVDNAPSAWSEPTFQLRIPLWMLLDDFLTAGYGFDWGNPRTEFERRLCNVFGLGDGTGVWTTLPI